MLVGSDWLGLFDGFGALVLVGSLLGVSELRENGHGGIMVLW